jgi:hypothetical protein
LSESYGAVRCGTPYGGEALAETELDSLELLIRHELAIKQLYELFAVMFPEFHDFWRNIVGEEQQHADLLLRLQSKETLKKWFLSDGQLKRLAIRGSLDYLDAQIMRISKASISVREALSIAKDLEDALIEKQFFKVTGSAPEEISLSMRDIVAESRQHQRRIAEALNAEKQKIK